ncbi:helix-turn-helix domain-containing protein [Catellatospora tritici]|uniref:helix-turn-helix domain-containing protein n=1 Tax=Catellatospora tritici TaxID=2851566 RepID=UPI001C2CC75B|nr:AraC family transcriptional regulator [Catellatospora tritici]MBV1850907.1 AraC family transcriptional regulator [Catellatospora tritici]MBV1851160.1 AraC family transcriptional regulator [Catellatospora tritici]
MSLPLHRLTATQTLTVPFAVDTFEALGPLSHAPFPHRHTFYEVVLVRAGTGTHVVDLAGYPLRPPHLAVVLPGRTHHWRDASALEGWLILLGEEFLAGSPRVRELLHRFGHRPCVSLGPDAGEHAGTIVARMRREYACPAADTLGVLRAYLHILLATAARQAGAPAPGGVGGQRAQLARRFCDLAARPGGGLRTVGEYAAALGVSAGHLGDAVRAATGRTPGDLIRQACAVEAMRLLAGTRLTVAQVAHEVGFVDPAYFCRFFRRQTGSTPGAFRRASCGDAESTTITGSRPSNHDDVGT